MLAYILAIAIAISSLALYLTAFLFPDLHRKDDFLWSGVGLFYALVLWVCAGRITGGVLLGQTASVLLLSWFGWQTMLYRKAIARPDQQAEILKFSLLEWVEGKLKAKKPVISTPKKAVVKEETSTENIETDTKIEEKVVTKEPEKTEIKQEIISTEKVEKITELKTETEEIQVKQETITEVTETPKTELKTELKTDKKGFSLSKLINKISAPFGKKTVSQENKPETKENVKTESLLETFKDEIWEEEEPIVENKTTEITTETIETIETIEKEPEKITVETTKIEEQIKKSEIVPLEKSIENATNLDEKEDKNEEKPETKSEKKEQESSDEDNPFKELTS